MDQHPDQSTPVDPDRSVAIEGLPADEAVQRVLDAVDGADLETVRATVARVAGDGEDGEKVVSRSAAESTLAHCSKVVTTAETRTEFAGGAVEDAREAAGDAPDLGVVEGRLSALEDDLATVETRADDLGTDLQATLEHLDDPDSLYAVGVGIRRLYARAHDVTRTADELATDAEEFGRWLDDPGRRVEDLSADIDAFEEFLDGIDRAVGALPEGGSGRDPTDSGGAGGDPGPAWFDASLRHHVTDALLADVGAELDDLRTWADRVDIDASARPEVKDFDALAGRIDDIDDRRTRLGARLDDLARPAWRDRYGDRLADFEAAIAGFDPPVDWRAVLAELDAHRPDPDGGSTGTDADPGVDR